MWAGHLFVTSDRGATWTESAFAPTDWDANGPFGRGFGDKMAVDPANPDVVLAGTPNTPMRASYDGGVTWFDTTVPRRSRCPRDPAA